MGIYHGAGGMERLLERPKLLFVKPDKNKVKLDARETMLRVHLGFFMRLLLCTFCRL